MAAVASNTLDPSSLDQPGAVFIDDLDPSRGIPSSYLFRAPIDVITASTHDEVPGAFDAIDKALARGRFVAGYISYEAGLQIDAPVLSRHQHPGPLLWLGVYDQCVALEPASIHIAEAGLIEDTQDIRPSIDEGEYTHNVREAIKYIAAGDVYQVNFTCRLRFRNSGTPRGLFARLRNAHPVPHSAFINAGDHQIISISPELFLRRDGQHILTRPMKGTMRRGRWFEEDERIANTLHHDEKNRAENVMIVDLMRNDLGRVCETGSIDVQRLFHVERYRSLFQMTSDVTGTLRKDVSTRDILSAVFPPGSVTGAPKVRAMEIIDELESGPRGPYCGCIGLFRPGGDCVLNVAIRTITQRGHDCDMGVGSGIVADSAPQEEWRETLLKGSFLTSETPSFHLLETMRLSPVGEIAFLDEHLRRMAASAVFVGWPFPEQHIRDALRKTAARVAGDTRLRLLLDENQHFEIETHPLGEQPHGPVRVLLSSRRTDPSDVFLYHKTTNREGYDADWRNAKDRGFFDVIYANLDVRITEGAITNILVEVEGQWYTPPLECGLLPGLWRQAKLVRGEAKERALTREDLRRATRIIVGNSVRGEIDVAKIEDESGETVWSSTRHAIPSR